MIQRFVIGKPFPTESVVLDLPAETGPVPYLTPDGDGWQYVMQEKDIVYGLGEMPRGLNKRGWHYETNNTDESEHGENRLSYYAAHNFLLISPADGSGCIGVFVDFPGKVSYDIGYTRHDTLRFATAEPNYALYLITAPTAAEVAKEFRQLIGPSYIPPKWAFGLAQSRFGYKTEADIREVAAQYKANGLPLDMICMKAALEDAPYFRPLAFDYPADPDAREVDDQLLLGEGLMVAPIHTQNAHGRTVYLPEGMKMLRLRSVSDYDEEVLPAGRHYLPCELGEVLLFIRPGHTVPVAQPAANTAQLDDTALTFWRFAPDGQPAPYRMYTDDGVTTDHNRPEHWRIVGQ